MNKLIMNKSALLVSLALAAIPLKAQVPAPTPVSIAFPGVPQYDHIVVVIEENKSYSDIVGASPPYIMNTLFNLGAAMTNSYSLAHPSEPNYFALYAGDTFGIADDNNYNEPDPSLATILAANGLTFTGYVESSSTNTGVPNGRTLAVRKHNPWESFPEGTTVEQDFSAFPTNAAGYAQLPKVSFVIPNMNDDMHNGTISQGDTWLSNHLSDYAQWALTHNSLLIVTWDEDSSSEGGGPTTPPDNQILTLLYGQYVSAAARNNGQINHYNVLATILAASGVRQNQWPRYSAKAGPITQVFSGVPTPKPYDIARTTRISSGITHTYSQHQQATCSISCFVTNRPSLPIASTGQFPIASMHVLSSSGVWGCLKTNE